MIVEVGGKKPSSEEWLEEAKKCENADQIGMFLIHNGIVRGTAKKDIYEPGSNVGSVKGMDFTPDVEKIQQAVDDILNHKGCFYARVWVANGHLEVGDNIMQVLVGADIRDNCLDSLVSLVKKIKTECVIEKEEH